MVECEILPMCKLKWGCTQWSMFQQICSKVWLRISKFILITMTRMKSMCKILITNIHKKNMNIYFHMNLWYRNKKTLYGVFFAQIKNSSAKRTQYTTNPAITMHHEWLKSTFYIPYIKYIKLKYTNTTMCRSGSYQKIVISYKYMLNFFTHWLNLYSYFNFFLQYENAIKTMKIFQL